MDKISLCFLGIDYEIELSIAWTDGDILSKLEPIRPTWEQLFPGAKVLTAERKLVGEESKISLTGVIDESANFQDLIGEPPQGKMAIDLHQVTRINSVGIKIWRDFFQELRSKGKEISFEDIPPALVSAMNYLTDFILKNEVKSVCAPFICSKCKKISLKVVKQEEIAAFASSIPALQCECGGGLEFDEIPEEYFSFFERS